MPYLMRLIVCLANYSTGKERYIMRSEIKKIEIPTLKFKSDYFKCPVPKCGWQYPGPLLIKGDVAPTTKCGKCGHVGLVRIK